MNNQLTTDEDERKRTERTFFGGIERKGDVVSNPEFLYKGNKYVNVPYAFIYDFDSEFSEGLKPLSTKSYWFKVEPIEWRIRNWEDLPKELNPEGTGNAKYIDVRCENGIISRLPFYVNDVDKNREFWQNSTIRGYLNGINVNNITENGNPVFSAPSGGDFTKGNDFLTQAFGMNREMVKSEEKSEEKKGEKIDYKSARGYGVKIQETPMSIDEQIKFYVDNGMSFMLHGHSGVGKSTRIRQLDPDFVSITLRNGMMPEEITGKTIYRNVKDSKGGEWKPPAWYVDFCEKCEAEPDKQHIIFIDELTNARENVQSLVYHLVLNKSIGPNIGKLPKNSVVAVAGNSKDDSSAAFNIPEPLFRRFVGNVHLPLDIPDFLKWGSLPRDDNDPSRLRIHPVVARFVGTYGKDVFYSDYDQDSAPEYALDPRCWEQISDIIYDNDGVIAKELIQNKVGDEIAQNFIKFASKPMITKADVLEKSYLMEDIPQNYDAKYALALSLRDADKEELRTIRGFVGKRLGEELLATFDSVWVGEDPEKAIFMDEVKSEVMEEYEDFAELPF